MNGKDFMKLQKMLNQHNTIEFKISLYFQHNWTYEHDLLPGTCIVYQGLAPNTGTEISNLQ